MKWDFLAIGGTILSSLAAVYALSQVFLARKAESHLIQTLITNTQLLEEITKGIQRAAQFQNSTHKDSDLADLSRLSSEIERAMGSLNTQERERIKDALYQPSVTGRINYISKLVKESAKTLTSQLPT
jgi:hypothetical protein